MVFPLGPIGCLGNKGGLAEHRALARPKRCPMRSHSATKSSRIVLCTGKVERRSTIRHPMTMSLHPRRLIQQPFLTISLLTVSACTSDDSATGTTDAEASPTDTDPSGTTDANETDTEMPTDPAATDGSSDAGAPTASGEAPEPPEPPSERAGEALGQFTLTLQPALGENAAYATLQGKIWQAPSPQRDGWETTLAEGDCLVREPRRPECDDECAPPAFCAVGDQCAEEPPTVDVGEVTVWGLENKGMTDSFVMTPLNPTTNQYIASGDAQLVFPPLGDADVFILEAQGGQLEPFIIATPGMSPVELTVEDGLPFEEDTPLELTWIPGDSPTARMNINVDISHHGGTRGEIVCDAEDTGELTIAASLVTKLLDLGFFGFPEIYVERYTRSFANVGDNHINTRVLAYSRLMLSIDGLRSCLDVSECEEGEMCVASMCVAEE